MSVSVIIPTYNRGYIIKDSVESVLKQDYEDFELIIVDDASSDNTEEIISKINDSRVIYHKMPQNGGVSRARNKGVELAKNNIIAFNDSDDKWHSDKLTKYLAYLEKHSGDVLVYSPYITTRLGKTLKVPGNFPTDELAGEIYPYLLKRNTISTQTIMTKKDVFIKQGGFDPGLPALEDWDLVIRMAKAGRIGYIDEILVDVEASEGGISSSPSNYYEARCKMLVKYMDDIQKLGLFDDIVKDIFERAERSGLLDSVKKMLMLHLSNV